MKQISALFAFLLAFTLASAAHAQFLPGNAPGQPADDGMIDRIVAVVEEDVILQSDLDQAMQSVQQQYASNPEQLPPHDVLERQVLNRLVLMKLQVQRAQEQGVRVSQNDVSNAIGNIASGNHMTPDQLRQAVTQQGGSFAAFQQNVAEQVLVQKLRDQVVQSSVQVTDAEIDNMLKDPSFNAGRVHLAHIEINLPQGAGPDDIEQAKSKADKAEQAIKSGMDFSAAAIRYSEAQDALDGGDLGWRGMNEIPPGFADLVTKMQPGEVTPPLRGPTGFHILKLIERQNNDRDVVTEYHARQILIKPSELVSAEQARQKAEDLYKKLTAKPKDFAKLAKENSDDDTSANIGGDLGWFQLEDHGEAVANALRGLKEGQVSEPFQTPAGWDIVMLEGQRESDVTDEMQRQRARMAIGNRKAQQAYEDFLRELRSSSFVDIRIPSLRDPDQTQNKS